MLAEIPNGKNSKWRRANLHGKTVGTAGQIDIVIVETESNQGENHQEEKGISNERRLWSDRKTCGQRNKAAGVKRLRDGGHEIKTTTKKVILRKGTASREIEYNALWNLWTLTPRSGWTIAM